ncbi:hypothetical protein [Luteimonas aquatica]|uniref:hypothetical protein n=1 Tax=Luteimonas aquatica TaxID=450364 RepID=UPI001F5678B7|nr:hypothetical protein [Luteimonas aquatica]
MTQRNNHPRVLQTTSNDVAKDWLLPSLPIVGLILVLVLITVQTGAGVGFA